MVAQNHKEDKHDGPIKLPKLGARLQAVYEQILQVSKSDDIVVDVGADHGRLAAHLAASGKFKQVLATDISAPSLNKTEQLCANLGLNVECVCCDGLTGARFATLAAICGMGGWEIIKILQQKSDADRFVLVAMQNAVELRQFLLKNKYLILKDYLVADHGKFYFIMVALDKSKMTRQQVLKYKKQYQPCRYGKLEKLFGQNFDVHERVNRQYLQNLANNLKFLNGFDTLGASNLAKKQIKAKQKYFKLVNELLQEGQR